MQIYHLFDVVGIELEYMIVDTHSLDVRPLTDKVLYAIAGEYLTEVSCGRITYSNELALHVIELKTTEPEPTLDGLDVLFQEHIDRINQLLAPHHAMLLPSACHPWMDPEKQMQLWPHEHSPIYEAYHRLFNCRGHGWANLQSAHINLPFATDAEFHVLHAAIRCILPLLPALAASSPILNGIVADKLDKRLDVYKDNQKRFPCITGAVIPEIVVSRKEYETKILNPIYEMIRPHDREGILQYEWINSRGAIARFDRNTIEIRVLDIQECPQADIAIAEAIIYVLQMLIDSKWANFSTWSQCSQDVLTTIFQRCVTEGDVALIDQKEYLKLFGIDQAITARNLLRFIFTDYLIKKENPVLELILREGPLARRMLHAYTKMGLRDTYQQLAHCLARGELFLC